MVHTKTIFQSSWPLSQLWFVRAKFFNCFKMSFLAACTLSQLSMLINLSCYILESLSTSIIIQILNGCDPGIVLRSQTITKYVFVIISLFDWFRRNIIAYSTSVTCNAICLTSRPFGNSIAPLKKKTRCQKLFRKNQYIYYLAKWKSRLFTGEVASIRAITSPKKDFRFLSFLTFWLNCLKLCKNRSGTVKILCISVSCSPSSAHTCTQAVHIYASVFECTKLVRGWVNSYNMIH